MYEREYHSKVHKNLLDDKDYYLFRAKCADLFYWKYLKGKVLEFGCGLGQNIFLHKNISTGIDVSDFALEECKKRGIRIGKNIKNIDASSFDSVLCVHTLEHLKNPYETVSDFYRILRPGGGLVIILPFSKNNKPIKHFKSDVAKHFYNWNFSSINEILEDAGFTIRLNKFNYAYGYSKLYKLPFKITIILLNLLGRLTDKKEMIIIAEK